MPRVEVGSAAPRDKLPRGEGGLWAYPLGPSETRPSLRVSPGCPHSEHVRPAATSCGLWDLLLCLEEGTLALTSPLQA